MHLTQTVVPLRRHHVCHLNVRGHTYFNTDGEQRMSTKMVSINQDDVTEASIQLQGCEMSDAPSKSPSIRGVPPAPRLYLRHLSPHTETQKNQAEAHQTSDSMA